MHRLMPSLEAHFHYRNLDVSTIKELARRWAPQVLAGVRKALWHQDLGLELQPLNLIREEPLLSDQEFSVYAAHYGTFLVQDL